MTAFGVSPALLAVATRAGDSVRVDIERVGVDIDEDRRRADQRRHFGGRAKRERRTDHRVARPDALRPQRQHQRVGAAGAGDGMARAAEFRELGLERAHFRAEDELAMAEHARNRGIDGAAEPAALRGDVDERNHGRSWVADSSLMSKQWRRSAGDHARRLPL